MSVPARISLATLGVADLDRATAFYQALGWPLSSASVPGEVSFFNTEGGLLALWGAYALAGDAAVDNPGGPPGFRGLALAVNVGSEKEVDEAFATVGEAGGTITKPPEHTEWGGYSGYFADPDGHLWEIAYNPGWPIGDDGRPRLP
ncbi:VOC family protein [Phytomonospora sp. NPDC050363]|uniref:VOC family protein n=1 Tax=Phytomonospora sp. NPDC050363 TaxID=3155642 RepID=UPI0034007E23